MKESRLKEDIKRIKGATQVGTCYCGSKDNVCKRDVGTCDL